MGLNLPTRGNSWVKNFLIWGHPLGCMAQNKFLGPKTEIFRDIFKMLFFAHFWSKNDHFWYFVIIFDTFFKNLLVFEKLKNFIK